MEQIDERGAEASMEPAEYQTNQKTAIVLIHGIGLQKQGQTIRQFTDGWRKAFKKESANRPVEIHRVNKAGQGETPSIAPDLKPEPENEYHVTLVKNGSDGPDIAVQEFYWADLSSLNTGIARRFRDFISLALAAGDVVLAALSSPFGVTESPMLRTVRLLAALVLWILAYPVIAVNFAYVGSLLPLAITQLPLEDYALTEWIKAQLPKISTWICLGFTALVCITLLLIEAVPRRPEG